VRGSQYPRLNADGTVTFRVTAKEARQVQVAPRGTGNGLGDRPVELSKDAMGIWTTTVPVRPGFHYYQLLVDGFPCNDPARLHPVPLSPEANGSSNRKSSTCGSSNSDKHSMA